MRVTLTEETVTSWVWCIAERRRIGKPGKPVVGCETADITEDGRDREAADGHVQILGIEARTC